VGVRRVWVVRRSLRRVRSGGREVIKFDWKVFSRCETRVGREVDWFDMTRSESGKQAGERASEQRSRCICARGVSREYRIDTRKWIQRWITDLRWFVVLLIENFVR